MLNAVKKTLNNYLPLSLGDKIGCGAFFVAALLALADIRLAAIPLTGFVILCLIAPFLQHVSFFLPVVSRGSSGQAAVALTFDDGPDPLTTPEILRLLKKHGARGTFFVNGRKAGDYPQLINDILSDGHCVANHSFNHDVFMAFKDKQTVMSDIDAVQNVLCKHGIVPLAFRPPAGITGPRLQSILRTKGMFTVNFSCRARDGGNRWLRHLSKKILRRIKPDDIVLLHDIPPQSDPLLSFWVEEVDRILDGIRMKGLVVLPLAELIGRPVMKMIVEAEMEGAVPQVQKENLEPVSEIRKGGISG